MSTSFNKVQSLLGRIDVVVINAAIFSKTDTDNLDLDECIMQMDVKLLWCIKSA